MKSHSPILSSWKIFLIFLRLGCTSFGGPVAHLGYFHDEFVVRRRWISEADYAEILALCHFLPGPSSSQVGMAIGALQTGWVGAFAAWLGFTLPSALLLILVAISLGTYSAYIHPSFIEGLKIAAIAVVAHATWELANKLCTDHSRRILALFVALFLLLVPSVFSQVLAIACAAVIGCIFFTVRPQLDYQHTSVFTRSHQSVAKGLLWLSVYTFVFIALALVNYLNANVLWQFASGFYRTGSLVFGGGHVVLPLLQEMMVSTERIEQHIFLAGYGITQAIPGPLFTFAAFLGASLPTDMPIVTALICLLAIFAPSYFLLLGVLPFWAKVREIAAVKAAMLGINAAVVGLLLAACLQMMTFIDARSLSSMAVLLMAFCLLLSRKIPVWLLVFATAFAHWILASL